MQTIDEFRPTPDAIEECRRWLTDNGVICHPTGFGLACSTPEETFNSLFPRRRNSDAVAESGQGDETIEEFNPPEAIAHHVDQITLSREPDFF